MTEPSRRLSAKAVPIGTSFYAQYTLPGRAGPAYVKSAAGVRATYETAAAAEQAALNEATAELARQRMLTAPAVGGRRTIHKLDKRQLAAEMAAIGLSADELDYILGAKVGRVRDWLDGKEEASHPARVILALLRLHPGSVDVAKAVTKQALDGH